MSNFLVEFVDDAVAEVSTVTDETAYIEVLISTPVSASILEIQEYLEFPDSWISVRTATVNPQFTMQGELVVKIGDGKYPIHAGIWKIKSITAMTDVVIAGGDVVVDINKNGVSIFDTPGDRVTIAEGLSVATVGTWDDLNLSAPDFITVDVDEVGTSGSVLVVSILLERTS